MSPHNKTSLHQRVRQLLTLGDSAGIKIPLSEKDKVSPKRSDSQLSKTSQMLGCSARTWDRPCCQRHSSQGSVMKGASLSPTVKTSRKGLGSSFLGAGKARPAAGDD